MPMLVLDPTLAKEFWALHEHRIETWDGLDVLLPLLDDTHQTIRTHFAHPIAAVTPDGAFACLGMNVSDRAAEWMTNYRCPDVVVYLNTNPAICHGTHWEGGPDILVEIISDGEDPHAKFDFYAQVNTREVLIVERDPWAVELFQLSAGKLVSAGRSDLSNGLVLSSGVVTLTFKLVAGTPRPRIEVTNTTSGRQWSC